MGLKESKEFQCGANNINQVGAEMSSKCVLCRIKPIVDAWTSFLEYPGVPWNTMEYPTPNPV